jgi:hypothetical protein
MTTARRDGIDRLRSVRDTALRAGDGFDVS